MMSTLAFVGAIVCFVALIPPSKSALTAYDCTSPRRILDMTYLPACQTTPMKSRTIFAELVERSPPLTVQAYRCLVTFSQWVVDSRGSKRVAFENASVSIGREACTQAHKTNSVVLSGEKIPFLNANGTIEHTVSGISPELSDSAWGFTYERTYQITLSTEIGQVDLKRDIVKFPETACDYSGMRCEESSGELYWKAERDGQSQTIYYIGDIVLVTSNETKISPQVTYAVLSTEGEVFALKTVRNETYDGEKVEFQTEVDNLYVVQRSNLMFYIRPSREALEEKLSKVYSESTGYETSDEVEVVKRLCKKQKTELKRRLDTRNWGSKIVESLRNGFIVSQSLYSDAYLLEKCSEKSVYLRETTECFEDIPVSDEKGIDMFLSPHSRLLNSHANAIKCQTSSSKSTETETEYQGQVLSPGLTYFTSTSLNEQSQCSYSDWFSTLSKYTLLALLLIWLIVVFIRVGKPIMCKGQTDKTPKTSFTFCECLALLRPPLMGDVSFTNRHTPPTLPQPNVKDSL